MKKKITSRIWRFLHQTEQEETAGSLSLASLEQKGVRIQEWIDRKRWMEDASLQDVADEIGIDKVHLSYWFRVHTGQSFLRWRTGMRIEEAKTLLLKERNLPTGIIGEAVGISDRSNFKRQFRELTGCTPAQWRLKHKPHIGLK